MNGHHLILGEQIDYLSGEVVADTHDERYRQSIAKLLIESKGYHSSDIVPRRKLSVTVADKCAIIPVDFTVVLNDMMAMIIRYGPGSIVTRHRPSIAVSRLLAPYQIPIVVVTNGIDADIIDGKTGDVLASGIDAIPDRKTLWHHIQDSARTFISEESIAREQRILYAYDVDDSCPCDDTICRL